MDRRSFLKNLAAVPLVGAAKAAAGASAPAGSLRIAHFCDPQFGFSTRNPAMKWRAPEHSKKNYGEDLARCERMIDKVNAVRPDLVLFGGDMTQNARDVANEWPELLKRLVVPWMVTPGNHDMGNNVTRENLDRFRTVFGRDREARDVKGWRIVAGNSQLWFKTEAEDEQASYEAWVAEELEKAKSYRGRVILASHVPPFAFSYDEKDSYDSCPRSTRIRRLESYVDAGARFYLAGHMHRFAARGYKNLEILNAEAGCDNFDLRPQGFRMFEVRDDFSYSYEFVEVR